MVAVVRQKIHLSSCPDSRSQLYARYDAFVDGLENDIVEMLRTESTSRRVVEQIALALSASLLIRHAPHDIADAFVASRLAGPWSGHFGTMPQGANLQAIARRVTPSLG
jgi:putative acyl-CoA dehydrogenase